MKIKEKGKKYERELVELLKKYGWNSRRIPASFLDVIATKNDRIAVFEVKFTQGKKIKIPKEQIANLYDWLSFFSYYPMKEAIIAIKFKRKGWKFINVKEIKDYSVSSDIISTWLPWE